MTILLITLLAAHVFLSLIAIAFSYATWMELAKSQCNLSYLRRTSVAAALLYVLAWLSGGYYYVVYYGSKVKPIILAGAYPWAHSFFLEVKEHVFMFLPFLAIAIAAIICSTDEQGKRDERSQKLLALLAMLTTIIGILVALAGVVTSGAVR